MEYIQKLKKQDDFTSNKTVFQHFIKNFLKAQLVIGNRNTLVIKFLKLYVKCLVIIVLDCTKVRKTAKFLEKKRIIRNYV